MLKESDIFEVEFKRGRKELFLNPSRCEIERDDYVIVEADRGQDIGFVCQKGGLALLKFKKKGLDEKALHRVLRPATQEDVDEIEKKTQKERDAFQICKQKIADHGLPMKLVDVEIQFDNSKITFYFTADQRVDFRELVKQLASIYRTRIELRQIGVRDEARRLGGCGICGRKQCCSNFIKEFEQVTTHMARDQQLSLNPAKISGNCGRLLCCLRYELDFYQDMAKVCPMPGCRVKGAKEEGVVTHTNMLKGVAVVKYPSGLEEAMPCTKCVRVESAEHTAHVEAVAPPAAAKEAKG